MDEPEPNSPAGDSGEDHRGHDDDRDAFEFEIRRKEERRMAARREGEKNVGFWLGMFGLVGWSVALPTVFGIALGVWIDKKFPSPYSWTLMMLFAGIVTGCLTAWYWIRKESRHEG